MDAVDEKIIQILSRDAKRTQTQIAERIGISLSSCQRRIKTLEQTGVISGYRAIVDPSFLGENLSVFVLIMLERHTRTDVQAFEAAIAAMPKVKEIFHIAGEYDFLIKIAVRDIASYQEFNYQYLNGIPGMARTMSLISLSDRTALKAL
ncbi:MAG: Lrp/AsnC family transcriptional regulator [Hyphomicrobiales bacterium]|nr:Lrp/AsnC family transcriptional regulator [Hyphomicrobiales bacterium]MCP5076425.1 Lrp/AsnC family transcriptional regulator [Paracoccaceae bacterium]